MNPTDYIIVAEFANDTTSEMRIFLEMSCEEIFLSPGHRIELLAKSSDNLLPITIEYISGGLQVFPNREFDPDWHIRFKGEIIKPQYPTRLSEFDQRTANDD